jgi:hypothetical protein
MRQEQEQQRVMMEISRSVRIGQSANLTIDISIVKKFGRGSGWKKVWPPSAFDYLHVRTPANTRGFLYCQRTKQ